MTRILQLFQPGKEQSGYSLHQSSGNKDYGSEKVGHLLKKSEGKVRKAWLKRKIWVKDGIMNISRSDVSHTTIYYTEVMTIRLCTIVVHVIKNIWVFLM